MEIIICKGKTFGKSCHRQVQLPNKYCSNHELILSRPPDDFVSTGLIPDMWDYITRYMSLVQIRSLYLTCKTLYWHFHNPSFLETKDDWFARNTRYVMITGDFHCINMTYQDRIGNEYKTGYDSCLCSVIYFHNELISGQHSIKNLPMPLESRTKQRPALFVINTHYNAKQMFMRINKLKAHAYPFECASENLEKRMFKYERNNICNKIMRTLLRSSRKAFTISDIHRCITMANAVVKHYYKRGFVVSFTINDDKSEIIYRLVRK